MVACRETKDDEDTTFVFLTNFEVDHKNAQLIADGGRQRWIIENQGVNEQKNGYELEHFCDCNNLNVMLCLYHLLQIAHLFMQLLERSNLIESMGHLAILAKLLLESIRNMGIPDDDIPRQCAENANSIRQAAAVSKRSRETQVRCRSRCSL